MGVVVRRRGDVCLVSLDPTTGSEIRKTRPCLILSPNELNQHLRTMIVAPMTTGGRAYPWRVPCRFQKRSGFVAVDQIYRTADKAARPAFACDCDRGAAGLAGNVRSLATWAASIQRAPLPLSAPMKALEAFD